MSDSHYDFPPDEPCATCGTHSWRMWDGWCCSRCYPDGPWAPGFGPDDDRSQDPKLTLQVMGIAGRALGVPADEVRLEGGESGR